jgi:hypothetical protein
VTLFTLETAVRFNEIEVVAIADAVALLPQLLATGAVEEITQQTYMAGLPPPYPHATPQDLNVVPAGPNRVRLL